MYKQNGFARTACIAMVLALAAFSYAIATGLRSVDEAPAVGSRVVSTNVNFANPFVDPTLKTTLDRDIGDAVMGSSLVRHVTAIGGLRPYTFTSTNVLTLSNNNLVLDTNGLFHTALTAATATTFSNLTVAVGAFRFDVTVKDSLGSGNSKTERYRLNVISQNQFRVAVSGLSTGQVFRDYVDNLDAINGVRPYTWSVAGSVTVGTTTGTLDTFGLHLAKDGTVFGTPLVAGNITFTAICTDAAGNVARSRSGATGGQSITIPVQGNIDISSTVVCTGLTLGGSTAAGGKDKFTYAGVFNSRGVTPTGNLTIQINDASFTVVIGANGKISGTPTQTFAAVKAPTIKGTVNSKGQLKLTGSNLTDFSNGLIQGRSATGAANPVPSDLGVMVRVSISGSSASSLDSAQALAVPSKTSTKGAVSGKYKIGVSKNGNDTLSGAFILTTVQGKDDVKASKTLPSGFQGDDWKVNFIAVPPSGVITNSTPTVSFDTVSTAVVSVGLENLPSVAATVKNGSVKVKGTKAIDNLVSLSIAASSGKGSYVTGALNTNTSAIPTTVSSAGAALTNGFSFGTTVLLGNGTTGVYSGSSSATIFPGKNKWTSTPPKGR